ncbi:hypothetical protein GY45DRAFT_1341256 [Cubamyces sp. BRFM 1775]|nr:hypothetical protein GY45DRAFT_1341256 [Cubamyces sp. BRFM 1775]
MAASRALCIRASLVEMLRPAHRACAPSRSLWEWRWMVVMHFAAFSPHHLRAPLSVIAHGVLAGEAKPNRAAAITMARAKWAEFCAAPEPTGNGSDASHGALAGEAKLNRAAANTVRTEFADTVRWPHGEGQVGRFRLMQVAPRAASHGKLYVSFYAHILDVPRKYYEYQHCSFVRRKWKVGRSSNICSPSSTLSTSVAPPPRAVMSETSSTETSINDNAELYEWLRCRSHFRQAAVSIAYFSIIWGYTSSQGDDVPDSIADRVDEGHRVHIDAAHALLRTTLNLLERADVEGKGEIIPIDIAPTEDSAIVLSLALEKNYTYFKLLEKAVQLAIAYVVRERELLQEWGVEQVDRLVRDLLPQGKSAARGASQSERGAMKLSIESCRAPIQLSGSSP